jgi:phospho-N-acetylmuramoyl-pentapeptide-transferase
VNYSLLLGTIAFLLTVIWGWPLIHILRRFHFGKDIRHDGPASHQAKKGTPTMGGIMVIVPILAVTIPELVQGRFSIGLPLATIMSCAVVGAVDDFFSITANPRNSASTLQPLGLLARYKFGWLLLISSLAAVGLHFFLGLSSVAIPGFAQKFELGLWYLPAAIFIIMGTAHAVNLTDGLDGLAGGTVAIALGAYGIIAYLQGQSYLVTFCFVVVGACLAFLWYNAYPALLFMGDTGALSLGATLGVVGLMTGQWLLLPVVGVVFVAEALSVVLQVAYFRWSGGKRLFRMAPLHHHFELRGWSEVQVVQRFWLIGMMAAMLGVALALF